MFLGFMRQKTLVAENRDLEAMKKKLDQTWDLSGASSIWEKGVLTGARPLFDHMFQKLNHTITAILQSVTVLASLGPELFKLSREFKAASRIQEQKIKDISNAGQQISQGVQEISARTQTLTQEFGEMKTEVSSALEKGDRSMAEFREIKDQVAVLVETIQVLKANSDSIGSIIKLKGQSGLEKGLDRNWSSKEWFQIPFQTCQTFVSKVYRSSATQSFCFTVAVPLCDGNGFSGVLGIDINFRDMLTI